MFEEIKEKLQTVEGVESLTTEQLFYAWRMIENGLVIPEESFIALCRECAMRLE